MSSKVRYSRCRAEQSRAEQSRRAEQESRAGEKSRREEQERRGRDRLYLNLTFGTEDGRCKVD